MSSSSLSEKVITITGAASGIGLATAHLLASRGAYLALADISASALSSAADRLKTTYPSAKIISQAVNVASSSQVNAWIEDVVKQYGRLDGAANLAGILQPIGKMVTELEDEEWDKVLGVNLQGVFYCMRAQLRAMEKVGGGEEGKGGSIVNAASIAGLQGATRFAPYSASKAASADETGREACCDWADKDCCERSWE
ncbi:MAG: hypothetical protein Q9195_004427 [Heterodermia aff. obscurata]